MLTAEAEQALRQPQWTGVLLSPLLQVPRERFFTVGA